MKHKNKTKDQTWPHSDQLSPTDQEILKWLDKLDDTARGYESKWGVGRLPIICDPALAVKFDRQVEKLRDAQDKKDLTSFRALAEGMIRAWAALEASAVERGESPCDVDYYEGETKSGRIFRVCKNLSDARAMAEKDIAVFSMEEIGNMLDSKCEILRVVKEEFPGAEIVDSNEPIEDEINF